MTYSRWMLGAVLLLAVGCSFLAPGYDTRQALLAKNHLNWLADGSAEITDETTHNGTTLLFESAASNPDGATVELNPAGMPVVKGATALFYRKTDPDAAADAYMKLAEQNQLAWSNTMQAMLGMTGQILQYRLAGQTLDAQTEPARLEARIQALERILARLEPLIGGLVPTPTPTDPAEATQRYGPDD